jgi:ribosome-binding protein aMBF1 (putative translation factor)
MVVGFPRSKGRWQPLSNKAIPINTASAWIKTSNDDLPGEKIITEPDLVLRQEPVRVVGDVELSIRVARERRGWSNPRDVLLNMTLP